MKPMGQNYPPSVPPHSQYPTVNGASTGQMVNGVPESSGPGRGPMPPMQPRYPPLPVRFYATFLNYSLGI
jgi:hypothetical protein